MYLKKYKYFEKEYRKEDAKNNVHNNITQFKFR